MPVDMRNNGRTCWEIRANILQKIGENLEGHTRYGKKRFDKEELKALENALP